MLASSSCARLIPPGPTSADTAADAATVLLLLQSAAALFSTVLTPTRTGMCSLNPLLLPLLQ